MALRDRMINNFGRFFLKSNKTCHKPPPSLIPNIEPNKRPKIKPK